MLIHCLRVRSIYLSILQKLKTKVREHRTNVTLHYNANNETTKLNVYKEGTFSHISCVN